MPFLILGCDAFAYRANIKDCIFYPSTPLKGFLWQGLEKSVDTSVYVLQCSSSQENSIPDGTSDNFQSFSQAGDCSLLHLVDSYLNEETIAGIAHMNYLDCSPGTFLELRMPLDLERFPHGMTTAYLDVIKPTGLLVGTSVSGRLSGRMGATLLTGEKPNGRDIFTHLLQLTGTTVGEEVYFKVENSGASDQVSWGLLVDKPINLGCFAVSEALEAIPADYKNTDVTPYLCLERCHPKRFAVISETVECRCFDQVPLSLLSPVSAEKCERATCSGDPEFRLFCGGDRVANVYVAECPNGWKRMGDNCHTFLDVEQKVTENADACADLVTSIFSDGLFFRSIEGLSC